MDLNAWLGSTRALSTYRDDIDRAYNTARVIADKSVSLTIQRVGASNHSETVRLEPVSSGGEQGGENATVSNTAVLIVGYKSHPSIDDTDIQRGDRFLYESRRYEVQHVLPHIPDRFLAIAEATQ